MMHCSFAHGSNSHIYVLHATTQRVHSSQWYSIMNEAKLLGDGTSTLMSSPHAATHTAVLEWHEALDTSHHHPRFCNSVMIGWNTASKD